MNDEITEASGSGPEPGLELPELPPGLQLEEPAAGGVRVIVRFTPGNRALVALPRLLVLAAAVATLIQAWRHHVFIVFWLFGLPLLRWFLGPAQGSLLIGERELQVEGLRLFRPPFVLPRKAIVRIEVTQGSLWQLFQRAVRVHTTDGRSARLLAGLSAAQAEFLNGGLQRWLSETQ